MNNEACEIDFLKKQLEAFRIQKRVMMQKLFTGIWRIQLNSEAL